MEVREWQALTPNLQTLTVAPPRSRIVEDRLTASTKLNDTSTLSHGMRTQDGSTYTNTDGRSENASASNQSGYQTANSTNRAQGSHTDETWGERASVNNSPVALAEWLFSSLKVALSMHCGI